ncbi:MAG: hypothetical protein AAGB31_15815, partial [Bdellovibrio sp.]
MEQTLLFPFAEYWWFYLGFIVFVISMLALDLGVFHKHSHAVSFKEASIWSVVWISLAMVFNVGLDYYVEAWRTTFGLNYNRAFAYSQDILQTGTTVSSLFNQRTEYNALNRLDFSVKVALSPNASISFSALNLTRPMFRTRQT